MCDNAVEGLFSLFASADRATALTGDLAEEREHRGSMWYWVHVVRITFSLWRIAAIDAPLRVLALMLAGMALLSGAGFAGVAAVFLIPRMPVIGWMGLPFFWGGGAFLTGACLVAAAPRAGMAACATLAVAGEAVLIGATGPAMWRDPSNTDFVLFCTTGIVSAMPLLAGAVVARWRMLVWGIRIEGQRSISGH
jgi:hypothetical protein